MKNQLLFGFSIIATGVFAQANDRPNVVVTVQRRFKLPIWIG